MRTCVMGFNHKCGCEDATDLRDALRDVVRILHVEQNDEQSDLSYDHMQQRRYAALLSLQRDREKWDALVNSENTALAKPRADGLEQTCVGCGRRISVCDSDEAKSCSFGRYRVG